MKRKASSEPTLAIDHSKLTDGHRQLARHRRYVAFDTYCGICGAECHVTASAQKYMLEVNRVPVKMLQRGAVFCEPCRVRRSRIKALRKEHPQRQGQSGVEELDRLEAEEADAQRGAGRKYEKAPWPYG